MPLVWLLGSLILAFRLAAARLLLGSAQRGASVLDATRPSPATPADPLVEALDAARTQLGIRRPVTLLLHPAKPIPLVWGIFRCRLMLPAAARAWSSEHLRSVLLHELAHVKRGDALAQLIAQLACALHWFNPLAWLALWRLGVERERACDDLVLASGVRPSAYAKHLLDAITTLIPLRGTQACALAMARTSSLESRLAAVLSRNLNRRRVSAWLAIVALAIVTAVVVPVAMLHAADGQAAAAPQAQPAPDQSKEGALLPPGTEEMLQWGEAANGLRAALVRPPALGEPDAAEVFDFKIVVQNISEAPIRFSTVQAPGRNPSFAFRKGGRTLGILNAEHPTAVDVTLKPLDVVVMRMFPSPMQGKSIVQDDRDLTFSVKLRVDAAPAGAWTGTLVTGEMTAGLAGHGLLPKNKLARGLFRAWNADARLDGKIPGAPVGLLADQVQTFIRNNPAWPSTPRLQKLLPRLDGSRDWPGREAIALLDELAALEDTPIAMALDAEALHTIHTGTPLPRNLANAPWGERDPSGLRLAWLLEPREGAHPLNTPLKSRILIHNAGREPVVFRTRTWHQGQHKAVDAAGAEVKTESVEWLTRAPLTVFRLAPGEFVELGATGIGLGLDKTMEDWQNTRVGTWIHVKAGDEITLTTSPVPLNDWNEALAAPGTQPGWWLEFVTAQLRRAQPLPPAGSEQRKRLLYLAAMDLFGTPVGERDAGDFVNDGGADALEKLARRLAARPGMAVFSGPLASAPTTFTILPPDPDAAKKPRTASAPGHYTLGENAALAVTRRPAGERIVNEAILQFHSPNPQAAPPGKPVAVQLPEGDNAWAAAWLRGGTVLWVQQKDGIRSYDFTSPAEVRQAFFEAPVEEGKVPEPIVEALRAAMEASETARPPAVTPPPLTPGAAPAPR